MDLIEDSLMNDSDWLNESTINLENTLWDSLSDKASNSSDTSSGVSDCSKQYDPCEGLTLDDFLPPPASENFTDVPVIKKVKREKKIITSNPNVKIIKVENDQDTYDNSIEARLGAMSHVKAGFDKTKTKKSIKVEPGADRKNDIIQQAMASSLTGAELKAYKRQQRMIRNRESASLSRQRRKAHVEQIEIRNAKLEKENKLLTQQVRQLQAQLANYQTLYVEVPTIVN